MPDILLVSNRLHRITMYCISNGGSLSKICCAFKLLRVNADRRIGLDFSSLSGYFAFIHRIIEKKDNDRSSQHPAGSMPEHVRMDGCRKMEGKDFKWPNQNSSSTSSTATGARGAASALNFAPRTCWNSTIRNGRSPCGWRIASAAGSARCGVRIWPSTLKPNRRKT